jgi:hypothetical protein
VGVIAAKLAEFTHGDGRRGGAAGEQPPAGTVVRGLRAGSVRTDRGSLARFGLDCHPDD